MNESMEYPMNESDETSPFEIEPCCDETTIVKVGETLDFRTAHGFRIFCQEQIRAGKSTLVLNDPLKFFL